MHKRKARGYSRLLLEACFRGLKGPCALRPELSPLPRIAAMGIYAPDFFSILAQESFRGRVRLKTRFPGVVSGSRQK